MHNLIALYLPREDIKLLVRLLSNIEVPTDDEAELLRFLEDTLKWIPTR